MPRPERPLDAAQDAVQRFAADLRALRNDAGMPTYRQLAERSGYAVSTVAAAAGGRRLPTLDVALAYAMACGGEKQEWSAKWQAAALALAEARGAPEGDNRAPYCGLSSFRATDADLFFGREKLVAEVVERIAQHQVTVVLGPSGAGKSSLLAAGVVPALRQPDLRAVIMSPGNRPWASLLGELGAAGDGRVAATEAVDAVLADTRLLIVVDQFEELYTLCDADERTSFIDGVLGLAGRADRRVRLVLGVRADFYGRCAEHPGLIEVLRSNQVLVGPMGRDELCAAVSRPALSVGLSVERALLVTVVNEAVGQAGVLPLLSHALLETWRRRRGDVLTAAGFAAAGGINAAVARTAETAFGALDPAARALAAEMLLRLLTLDEDTGAAVRRRVDVAELLGFAPDADAVVDRLACARLITVDQDTAEIAHDAVLTAWPRLRGWIDDHRDALRVHRSIAEATRIWAGAGHDPATLATGARLEHLRAYAESGSPPVRLSQEERAFLDESTAQVRRSEAAVRRRSRLLTAVTSVAVVCAVFAGVLAVVAGNARTDALNARNNALSRQLALTAAKLRGTDPALAAQIAVAGHGIARTTEARSALLESSSSVLPVRFLGGAGPTALDASADGAVVAVSDATDGSVQLFTRTTGRLVRAKKFMPRQRKGVVVYALALSPDGRTLAIGDMDATITLWRVSDPYEPKLLTGSMSASGPVERLDIDQSGTQLAAAGGDRILRWDIADVTNPRPLDAVPAPSKTKTVTYGPGGLLAFGTESGTVHLWSGTELAVLGTGGRLVPTVSISPDGRTLVAGSHDCSLRAWDISEPAKPSALEPRTGPFELRVTATAFSPDGRYLLAGSADSTIRVLDARTWSTLQTLPHPDVVSWATFTDSGESVASVASDGALRVWPISPQRRSDAPIADTPFSADGTRLAVLTEGSASLWDTSRSWEPLATGLKADDATFSGAGDLSGEGTLLAAGTTGGEVHLFDVTDARHPVLRHRLGGSRDEVTAVAFSPDGTLLAAGGRDTSIRVWDLSDPVRPMLVTVFETPEDLVLDLDWRPSGKVLAAASGDSFAYLFDLTGTPTLLSRVEGLDSYAFSAVFNPAGTLLAVGGVDSVVVLWDVTDPAAPRRTGELTGPTGRIFELTFHPDGDVLAAAVIDGSTWLWNVTDPAHATRTAVLTATGSPVNTAVFRPVGDLLLTGGGDRALRTWQTDEAAVVASICVGTGDSLTEREWNRYLPELPYSPVCPKD
ncbi:nSTAND1 domain-containing NTPase [Lentzea sp. NPDC055074]